MEADPVTVTPWGRRRGITAVAPIRGGYIVFGRDWHAVVKVAT